METSANVKNVEIEETFKNELASKSPVVFHLSEPKKGNDGETYQQLFIAQRIESTVEVINELFLGWKPLALTTRCIRNIKVSAIESNPYLKGIAKAGAILTPVKDAEGNMLPFNIQYTDHTQPQYADQTPLLSKVDGELKMVVDKETGLPIYRTTELVTGKANNKPFKNIDKVDYNAPKTFDGISTPESVLAGVSEA